ncbi:hypothetical protein EDD18DRAFT_1111152 [Armillaria luteobubalina]|uniref:Uncharacterized protein n=1 Tax=Armillaria luteobubalina TaxID=153913 RepID=A0AA39UGP6_9AGAR|nr:hypothetical protein EDD18DRAFT_1111152 [Armillaria luteobubalina]
MTLFTPDQLAAALAALGINEIQQSSSSHFRAVNAPSDGPPRPPLSISPLLDPPMRHTILLLSRTLKVRRLPLLLALPSRLQSDQMVLGMQLRKAALSGFIVDVTGVGRACYFRYPTQAAALAAFNEAVQAGAVEILYVYVPLTLSFHTYATECYLIIRYLSFLEESSKKFCTPSGEDARRATHVKKYTPI